jgi:hypothetical protein
MKIISGGEGAARPPESETSGVTGTIGTRNT